MFGHNCFLSSLLQLARCHGNSKLEEDGEEEGGGGGGEPFVTDAEAFNVAVLCKSKAV